MNNNYIIGEEQEILMDVGLVNIVNVVNPYRKAYNTRKPCVDNMNRWDDHEFIRRYRVSKVTVNTILEEISDQLRSATDRNHAVLPLQQFLLTLRFLATGSFYITIGDYGGIHKSTAGKIIQRVIYALAQLRERYVHLPTTEAKKQATVIQFARMARFPHVLGAIDCTHIKLQSPGGNIAENFRNRKGYFSLNVQVVCNAQQQILDIVARWPGASHDSYIFNNSGVRMRFEAGEFENVVLLGDSGYPLRSYLLTPLEQPRTAAEHLYNEAQIRTRNVVDRTFGIWKRRFPVLSIGIRSKLQLAQAIIVACAVLHNIACANHDELPDNDAEDNIIADPVHVQEVEQDNVGVAARNSVIRYFEQFL